jgi:hypothetical protein
MTSPLSEKAIDALAKLHEHGELERWKNGYWTYPGCAVHHRSGSASYKWGGFNVPLWSVGTRTITSLIKRQIVVVVEKYYGRPSVVKLAQMNSDELVWEQTGPGIMTAMDKPR